MEHEIDLAPRQLMRWLEAELGRAGARRFAVRASREFLGEPATAPDMPLDPEDDLEAMTTVGYLEVAPLNGAGDWRLTLRLEDQVGAHLPEDGSVPDGPEEMPLADFARAFAAGDDLDSLVTLEAATAADRRKAERLIARILSDHHGH